MPWLSFAVDMQTVPLSRIQSWIDQSRLDPGKPITIRELAASRCVSNICDGIKLLADGSEMLRTPIHVIVSRASASAIAAVEKLGGSVTTRYYTRWAIQRILRGSMDPMHSLKSDTLIGGEAQDGDVERAVGEEEVESEVVATLPPRRTGFQHRLPDPTSRKDIEYYRDPEHRGYLSHLVMEGQTPSLFFRAPGTGNRKVMTGTRKKVVAGENRIW